MVVPHPDGYTIAETLIVLAITGILFISAYALFAGQRGETEFSQAVRDTDSKIQSYASEVSAGALPNGQAYACSSASGRPVLDTSMTSTIGNNQDCLFLGRAIQVAVGQNGISIYTVLGNRTQHNGATDTGIPSTGLADASPTPAQDKNGAAVWLDTYNLQGGVRVISSKVNSLAAEYDLVGFYTSAAASGNSTDLLAQGYQLSGNVTGCIENGSSCGAVAVSQWNLCLGSADGSQTALLSANILPGGVTTNLSFANCS